MVMGAGKMAQQAASSPLKPTWHASPDGCHLRLSDDDRLDVLKGIIECICTHRGGNRLCLWVSKVKT